MSGCFPVKSKRFISSQALNGRVQSSSSDRPTAAVLSRPVRKALALWPLLLLLLTLPALSADIRGLAKVQADGSLRIRGTTIQLHGIHIPRTNRICDTKLRPIRCRTRAILALERRIRGFVRCTPLHKDRHRRVRAICIADGEGSVLAPKIDLGAWMIEQGWAVAAPGAPFEYVALERIARTNRRGVWGFQVDQIR